MSSIAKEHRLAANPDVVSRKIQGEEVLLQLATGKYFGLDEVGTAAWASIVENGKTLEEAANELAGEYLADQETILSDLLSLASEMKRAELVSIA